jgi:hypothetical protein
MTEPQHLLHLESCPYLPEVTSPLRAAEMKICGSDRGVDFFLLALKCAQSLWLQGLPAQALLLINRAFGADLSGVPHLERNITLPYAAVAWILQKHQKNQFIGNPRRHYQHLATRMVQPRKDLRTWRAWACWYIACQLLPDCPPDRDQIEKENVMEPARRDILDHLKSLGLPGEDKIWMEVVAKL